MRIPVEAILYDVSIHSGCSSLYSGTPVVIQHGVSDMLYNARGVLRPYFRMETPMLATLLLCI